jgi:hypothetical protein
MMIKQSFLAMVRRLKDMRFSVTLAGTETCTGVTEKNLQQFPPTMSKHHLQIHEVSGKKFLHTISYAVLGSALIVGFAATLGRATINLKGALVDKPDIAIYLLLPDENISTFEKLRSRNDDTERDYLVETPEGPKYVKLKKAKQKNEDGKFEWFVESIEPLKE